MRLKLSVKGTKISCDWDANRVSSNTTNTGCSLEVGQIHVLLFDLEPSDRSGQEIACFN